ncbi:MAG TPA: formylmethanofuran dehydrogenase subunit C [Longimicrobiales bacterium]
MSGIVLALRSMPRLPLEAENVRPDALSALSENEIARVTVWHGREPCALGDFFDVRGGRSADVRITGDCSRVKGLGVGMAGGSLLVEGNAGAHVGAGMTGGTLRVSGDAGDWAGAEMAGGTLEIAGSAGDHLAGAYAGSTRGMRGGVVIVRVDAGEFAAERLRRGLVAVAGNVGDHAGLGMIAGTLLVLGDVGRRPGAGLKRGSIVVHGRAQLLPTFRYACTYVPPVLALVQRVLLERHGLDAVARYEGGAYRRFTGDYADLGKGEILLWE